MKRNPHVIYVVTLYPTDGSVIHESYDSFVAAHARRVSVSRLRWARKPTVKRRELTQHTGIAI